MSSPTPGAGHLHILEVRTRGLRVEARLNDIPVFTENAGRGRLFQIKCEPYLVSGENELRVGLRLAGGTLVDAESQEVDESKKPYCRVRLVRVEPEEPGESAGPDPDRPPADSGAAGSPPDPPAAVPVRDLVAYAWDPEQDPIAPGRVLDAGPWFFYAESPGGRWSWEDAPVFQPGGEDPAEIRVLIDKLWRAVSFRDAAAVVYLTSEKTRELAVALGVNAAELEMDQANYLTALFTAVDWAVAPLEQGGLLLEPAARGRLVEIRTVDGEAPIRGGSGNRAFVLRPMVAKISGRWRVVR